MENYFNTWYPGWDHFVLGALHFVYFCCAPMFWNMFATSIRKDIGNSKYRWKHAVLAVVMGLFWPVSWLVILFRYVCTEVQKHDWSKPPSWM